MRVEITSNSDYSIIAVKDDGPGFGDEVPDHLFDRFYRADASRSKEKSGNGLGLSIAQTIVQAHRGRIRAESTFGKDAAFIVTLSGL